LSESPFKSRRRGPGRDHAVKREALLAAAAALIRERGYDGASLAELAERLNVTKPTIYHYFGGKAELYAEIVARSQGATIDFIREAAEGPGTARERLRRIMLGYAGIVNGDLGTGLIFSAPPELTPETRAAIRARAREANALILRVFEDGAADGTLTIGDPMVTLQTLFGALNWTPNWFRRDGRIPLADLAEQVVDVLLAGVASAR
jgi:AcrR family transcriptional regulator